MIQTLPDLAQTSLSGIRNAAVLILICVAAEFASPRGSRITLRARFPGALFSLTLPAFSVVLSIPLQAAYKATGFGALIVVPLADWVEPLGVFGAVLSVATLILFGDFLEYWRHRVEHAVFWPVHAVHHAPTELHAANGFGHPLQVVTNLLCVKVPMSFIQMQGAFVPVVVAITITFMVFFIHSPTAVHFGPLRYVVVDNRFHRIHHSVEERHHNKNLGITFTLWDQLFGTAYFPGRNEWPDVGIPGHAPPATLKDFLCYPLRLLRRSKGIFPHFREASF